METPASKEAASKIPAVGRPVQIPTVGRIVIFCGEDANGTTEHPAVITRVWGPGCVNLCVMWDAKEPSPRTSVMHKDMSHGSILYWRWPNEAARHAQ